MADDDLIQAGPEAGELSPAQLAAREAVKNAITKVLEDGKYPWRTVRGVARSADLNENVVEKFFQTHPDQVIEAPTVSVDGDRLYTTRVQFLKSASPLTKLAGAFKNRIL